MKFEDYERKFEQLSRYAPHLVNTEAKKARRFELELHPEIGGILASHQFTTYNRVLQIAQAISNRLELTKLPSKGSSLQERGNGMGPTKRKEKDRTRRLSSDQVMDKSFHLVQSARKCIGVSVCMESTCAIDAVKPAIFPKIVNRTFRRRMTS